MINSICVLGSGTAGLISAMLLKTWYPHMDINVISSSNIGIVGVGEGSTEHWKEFMNECRISFFELFTETDATMKAGINFENWNGDGKSYFHALHANYTETMPNGMPGLLIKSMIDGRKLYPRNIEESRHFPPVEESVNQFHFDTRKLNLFFVKKCKQFGINFVDDDIVDVILDDNGFVSSLKGQHNTYSADFFVDASGFKRVINSKLGGKWIDCKKYLPMNSAFAFPSDFEENYPSWTLSKALSSGWMWRIPTQNRYGNGYVFCDEFINEDQAYAEIQEQFDGKVDIAKTFKFSAGYVDRFWIKNCVAVGLSGSFVEPLEATSIGTSIQQAFALGREITTWNKNNTQAEKIYNKQFTKVLENIVDFVQLHYLTKRNDSDFWKNKHNLITLTDFNAETFEHFKEVIPTRAHFSEPWILFHEANWIQVLYGLELINVSNIKQMWNNQDPQFIEETNRLIENVDEYQERLFSGGLSHQDAINLITFSHLRTNGYQ